MYAMVSIPSFPPYSKPLMISIVKSPSNIKGYTLTAEQRLAESREEIFSFFADARQLETLTPPSLSFALLNETPIEMQTGTLIDYQLRIHGIPIRWQSKISVWEPPVRFVDEQMKGPYRFWRHEHLFEETDQGVTVRDIVHYAVPLGGVVHTLFVKRDLKHIFEYRQQKLAEIFTPVKNES